eukprot:COSAG05_NODE_558_length_8700_cov_12.828973_4_plen_63_part_00
MAMLLSILNRIEKILVGVLYNTSSQGASLCPLQHHYFFGRQLPQVFIGVYYHPFSTDRFALG